MPLSLRRPAVSLSLARCLSSAPPLFRSLPLLCSLFLSLSSSRRTEDDNGDRKRGESETGITRAMVLRPSTVAAAWLHPQGRIEILFASMPLNFHNCHGRAQLYATVAATSRIVCKININEDPRGFSL